MYSVQCSYSLSHLSQLCILKQTRDYFHWLNADWTSPLAKKCCVLSEVAHPHHWLTQADRFNLFQPATRVIQRVSLKQELTQTKAKYGPVINSALRHMLSLSLSLTQTHTDRLSSIKVQRSTRPTVAMPWTPLSNEVVCVSQAGIKNLAVTVLLKASGRNRDTSKTEPNSKGKNKNNETRLQKNTESYCAQ